MPSNNPNPGKNLTPEGRSKGGSNSRGNFKHDRARASEMGRKGGMASHRRQSENASMTEH